MKNLKDIDVLTELEYYSMTHLAEICGVSLERMKEEVQMRYQARKPHNKHEPELILKTAGAWMNSKERIQSKLMKDNSVYEPK